jgi:hypothetical protein
VASNLGNGIRLPLVLVDVGENKLNNIRSDGSAENSRKRELTDALPVGT